MYGCIIKDVRWRRVCARPFEGTSGVVDRLHGWLTLACVSAASFDGIRGKRFIYKCGIQDDAVSMGGDDGCMRSDRGSCVMRHCACWCRSLCASLNDTRDWFERYYMRATYGKCPRGSVEKTWLCPVDLSVYIYHIIITACNTEACNTDVGEKMMKLLFGSLVTIIRGL